MVGKSSFDLYHDHYIEFSNKWLINNYLIERPIGGDPVILKRKSKLFTSKYDSLLWCPFLNSTVRKTEWKKVQIDRQFPMWCKWSIFSDKILIMSVRDSEFQEELGKNLICMYDLTITSDSLSPFLSIRMDKFADQVHVFVTKEIIHIFLDWQIESITTFKHYELEMLNFKD